MLERPLSIRSGAAKVGVPPLKCKCSRSSSTNTLFEPLLLGRPIAGLAAAAVAAVDFTAVAVVAVAVGCSFEPAFLSCGCDCDCGGAGTGVAAALILAVRCAFCSYICADSPSAIRWSCALAVNALRSSESKSSTNGDTGFTARPLTAPPPVGVGVAPDLEFDFAVAVVFDPETARIAGGAFSA